MEGERRRKSTFLHFSLFLALSGREEGGVGGSKGAKLDQMDSIVVVTSSSLFLTDPTNPHQGPLSLPSWILAAMPRSTGQKNPPLPLCELGREGNCWRLVLQGEGRAAALPPNVSGITNWDRTRTRENEEKGATPVSFLENFS